jgi:hypothetical protein
MLLDEIVENLFVGLHRFAALENAEVHHVDVERGFDTRTHECERHHQFVWRLLIDPELNAF